MINQYYINQSINLFLRRKKSKIHDSKLSIYVTMTLENRDKIGHSHEFRKEERRWWQTAGHLLWNLPWWGELLSCRATRGRRWVDVFHWGGAHRLTGGKLHGILEDICQRAPLGAGAITQIPERQQREGERRCQRDAGKPRQRDTSKNRGQDDRCRGGTVKVRNYSAGLSREHCWPWLNTQVWLET